MGYEKHKRPVFAPQFSAPLSGPGIGSASLDPQVQQLAVVPLTAAQLKSLFSTPLTVLPAPGAGYALILEQALLEFKFGTIAYTGGGALSLVYHGNAGALHSGTVPASVITAGSGQSQTLLGPQTGANGLTVLSNTGIDLTNATQNFAAGNGLAQLWLWYTIATLF